MTSLRFPALLKGFIGALTEDQTLFSVNLKEFITLDNQLWKAHMVGGVFPKTRKDRLNFRQFVSVP
jgi:hypothetical protein